MDVTRWRTALIAMLLLVAALAACDDAPEPRVADEPTPSSTPTSVEPSPTESPTPSGPSEPTLPAEAQNQSDAGARAFVKYWVELVNYSGATGDTASLRARSELACEGCLGLADLIDGTYDDGGHIEGGDWSIGRLRDLPLDHDADWAGFAEAQAEPQKIVAGDGTSTGYNGGPFYFYSYLAWSSNGWAMTWLRTPDPQ